MDFDEEELIKTTDNIDVNQVMQKRAAAFLTYEAELAQFDPEPVEPEPYSFKELGLKFVIVLITSISAVIQAAMRTGAKFMELASKSEWDVNLQRLDGVTAMIGVEGIVFMAGWMIGSKKKGRHSIENSWELYAALGISLSISIVTGTAQATTTPSKLLDTAVLVMLGPGASILAFFAGELVGIVINEAVDNAKARMDKWQIEHDAWKARMIESWKNSEVYKMLNVDIEGASEVQAKRYKVAGKSIIASQAQPRSQNPQKVSLRKQVEAYLQENGYTVQDIGINGKMTVAQLTIELGMTPERIPDPKQLAKAKSYLTKVMADLRKAAADQDQNP